VPFDNAKTTHYMQKNNKLQDITKTCLSELHHSITFGQNNTIYRQGTFRNGICIIHCILT